MELANVAVVVSATIWKGFGMADTNTNKSGTPDITLDAAPVDIGSTADTNPTDTKAAGTKASATQQLKDEASKFTSQAADRAREYVGQGKERATGALDDFARMMAGAADDVDARIGSEYGRYARTAADSVTGFADALRGKEVDDLIEDATAFVRKSPVIAVGTAAAIGFVLARLVKSGIDAASDTGDRASPGSAPSV